MDERLTRYFERRFDELQTFPTPTEFGARTAARSTEESWVIVRDALAQVSAELEAETGKRLRGDGGVALNLGFTELIARPLLEEERIPAGELKQLLSEDMRHVAMHAARITDDDEVSSHAVISAIDQTWPELRLASMPYW